MAGIITTLPKHSISWKNLNPGAVLNEVGDLLDSSIMRNFYQRVGFESINVFRQDFRPE